MRNRYAASSSASGHGRGASAAHVDLDDRGNWGRRTSGGRRDSGIRRKLISSVSARLKGEPDKGDLQGQSDPGEHFGHLVVAVLGGYGGLQVGRPDDDQEHRGGDPSPPVPAPKPDRADELDHPAGVDQFGRPRQNTRDKGRENGRAGQVHKPANREEGCDDPGAVASAPMMTTTGCLHRLTLRPMTRWSGPHGSVRPSTGSRLCVSHGTPGTKLGTLVSLSGDSPLA